MKSIYDLFSIRENIFKNRFAPTELYASVSSLWKPNDISVAPPIPNSLSFEQFLSSNADSSNMHLETASEILSNDHWSIHAETPESGASQSVEANAPSKSATTPEPIPEKPCPRTIRHIILSGGGEVGFAMYSSLRESNKAGFWDIQNIETVYATSVGAIFSIVIVLLKHFNWDIYDNYIIKRPWHHVFDFNFNTIIHSIRQNGIFDRKIIEGVCAPLFSALDLPIDINMQAFYEFTGIELHINAADLHRFELIDFSHKTHPDWKIVDVIYCSCCLPVLFIPFNFEKRIYADGGIICNYPVHLCIENGADPEEIFGLTRVYEGHENQQNIDTLFDYIFYIIGSILTKVSIPPASVKNQLRYVMVEPFANIFKIYKSVSDITVRMKLIQEGVDIWNEFYRTTYPPSCENRDSDTLGPDTTDTKLSDSAVGESGIDDIADGSNI